MHQGKRGQNRCDFSTSCCLHLGAMVCRSQTIADKGSNDPDDIAATSSECQLLYRFVIEQYPGFTDTVGIEINFWGGGGVDVFTLEYSMNFIWKKYMKYKQTHVIYV